MQPAQRKYLTERLVKVAKEKIEKLNEEIRVQIKEHNKNNKLTKEDLFNYLTYSISFKGELSDSLSTYTSDLFNLDDVRKFVGKEALFDTSDNNKITLNNDYVYVSSKTLPNATLIKQKMIQTIDEIMLGDSNKAVELMTKFEDFSV